MDGERLPLLPRTSLAEEARLRNLGKRLKLQSKRLRQLWPNIAAFLRLRDVVSLSTTSRRLKRLLDNDRVWQNEYDRVASQSVTRLLLPHVDSRFGRELSTKEKLRRVIHARRVHDPTNALQMRLREAERKQFQLQLWQCKVRSVIRVNLPLVILLCCLSAWSYSSAERELRSNADDLTPQLRGSSALQPVSVNPVKTFVLVTDALLLVSLVVLTIGSLSDKALYTVGVLVAIEVAVMMAEFVAWSSTLQVLHSFVVLAMLLLDVVLATKNRKEYRREMDAFRSTY